LTRTPHEENWPTWVAGRKADHLQLPERPACDERRRVPLQSSDRGRRAELVGRRSLDCFRLRYLRCRPDVRDPAGRKRANPDPPGAGRRLPRLESLGAVKRVLGWARLSRSTAPTGAWPFADRLRQGRSSHHRTLLMAANRMVKPNIGGCGNGACLGAEMDSSAFHHGGVHGALLVADLSDHSRGHIGGDERWIVSGHGPLSRSDLLVALPSKASRPCRNALAGGRRSKASRPTPHQRRPGLAPAGRGSCCYGIVSSCFGMNTTSPECVPNQIPSFVLIKVAVSHCGRSWLLKVTTARSRFQLSDLDSGLKRR
jgi:hypothetical protein